MKFLSIVFLSSFVFLSSCQSVPIEKQEQKSKSQATNLDRTQIEKILVSRFEQIAGGYYINELCSFITQNEKTEYVGKIAQLNIYASKLVGRETIMQHQRRGRLGAATKPYRSCGKEANDLFEAALMLTTMMHEDLILKKT